MEETIKKINKITIINYVSIAILFVVVFLVKNNGERNADRMISVLVLVGSTLFSVALPILLRTGFYQKSYKNKGMSQKDFLKMKTLIVISVFIGFLFAIFGYYYPVFKYHLYLSFLVGIWGIYSIFPSNLVLKRDFKDFAVED